MNNDLINAAGLGHASECALHPLRGADDKARPRLVFGGDATAQFLDCLLGRWQPVADDAFGQAGIHAAHRHGEVFGLLLGIGTDYMHTQHRPRRLDAGGRGRRLKLSLVSLQRRLCSLWCDETSESIRQAKLGCPA